MVLLGVVIALLIPAPFTSTSRWLSDLYENFLGPLMVAAAIACVLSASVLGAVVMMGWRAGIVGVVFTASMTAASAGALTEDAMWMNIGFVGFVLSCAGYFFIGDLSGYLPLATRAAYGAVAMIPGGIIIGIIGIATESTPVTLFGFCGAGAATGVALAQGWRRLQRRKQDARVPITAP